MPLTEDDVRRIGLDAAKGLIDHLLEDRRRLFQAIATALAIDTDPPRAKPMFTLTPTENREPLPGEFVLGMSGTSVLVSDGHEVGHRTILRLDRIEGD